ncbi:hypothetical protein E2C01_080628 [Portunus trituberculatus]|uniref:Uncharacterized protein n=1 Tax=Portunus trituberculatus TaxID=210409 RepID=A0A5B7IMP3_PORTR|nr:hypothetical protein [Portunus trituberculatus]
MAMRACWRSSAVVHVDLLAVRD